jgi:transcriptional regulator of acetoin/glycerol metabolism
MACLMAYHYPGNVRELENAIEHAFVICGGNTVKHDDLPLHVCEQSRRHSPESPMASPPRTRPLENAEAATIRDALARHGGNRSRAARDLGISRNTLWRKMKRHGIN